jgi:hypothetical protein
VSKGAVTPEQKSYAEQVNEFILVQGTEGHVTRSKFSRNKSARIEREKNLSGRFENNPNDTYLALELKVIDDQIAKCSQEIQRDGRNKK